MRRLVAIALSASVCLLVLSMGGERLRPQGRWNPGDELYDRLTDPSNAEGAAPVAPALPAE